MNYSATVSISSDAVKLTWVASLPSFPLLPVPCPGEGVQREHTYDKGLLSRDESQDRTADMKGLRPCGPYKVCRALFSLLEEEPARRLGETGLGGQRSPRGVLNASPEEGQ